VKLTEVPAQILLAEAVIDIFTGLSGITVTMYSTVLPAQFPIAGVIEYVTVSSTVFEFVSTWLIIFPLPGEYPETNPEEPVADQENVAFGTFEVNMIFVKSPEQIDLDKG
jgi:hypothetical protein